MKEILEKLVSKKTEYALTEERFNNSTDAIEVRSLGDALAALKADIANLEAELEKAQENEEPKEEKPAEDKPAKENPVEEKSAEEEKQEARSNTLNPLASYGVRGVNTNMEKELNVRNTMEYRSAFMNYVQKGTLAEPLQFRNNSTNEVINYRADTPITSADLGVMLPETVIQEVIKDLEKSYGQLYSKVRKFNVKGGVKIPVGSFSATFKRIAETGAPSDRQKGGEITGAVQFTYKLGEVRISQTLLESILSVEAFEKEVANTIVEAYLKAMEEEILNGVESANQCEGILTNAAKIPAANIIEFTEDEMKDWKAIQKKLFAKVPLAMRKEKPEFVMTVNTYEGNLKALVDDNNRPLAKEVFNPTDGVETATFNNKEVVLIEEGLGIKNFDEAATGEYFAMYWVPNKAYGINSNLEFATKRYFDEEKLEYVNRAVCVNDGKILNPKYIFLLKKKIGA
jgi:HK97 family phage major capsid protein